MKIKKEVLFEELLKLKSVYSSINLSGWEDIRCNIEVMETDIENNYIAVLRGKLNQPPLKDWSFQFDIENDKDCKKFKLYKIINNLN